MIVKRNKFGDIIGAKCEHHDGLPRDSILRLSEFITRHKRPSP